MGRGTGDYRRCPPLLRRLDHRGGSRPGAGRLPGVPVTGPSDTRCPGRATGLTRRWRRGRRIAVRLARQRPARLPLRPGRGRAIGCARGGAGWVASARHKTARAPPTGDLLRHLSGGWPVPRPCSHRARLVGHLRRPHRRSIAKTNVGIVDRWCRRTRCRAMPWCATRGPRIRVVLRDRSRTDRCQVSPARRGVTRIVTPRPAAGCGPLRCGHLDDLCSIGIRRRRTPEPRDDLTGRRQNNVCGQARQTKTLGNLSRFVGVDLDRNEVLLHRPRHNRLIEYLLLEPQTRCTPWGPKVDQYQAVGVSGQFLCRGEVLLPLNRHVLGEARGCHCQEEDTCTQRSGDYVHDRQSPGHE